MEVMTHHKDHASQTPSCWNLISKRRFRRRHQQDPPQKQTSDGSQTMSTKNKGSTSETKLCRTPTSQPMVHLRYHKTEKRKPQPQATTELHLRNQNLTELNLNLTTCPFGPHQKKSDAVSETNSWQHPTHIWGPEQDMNQTQVFFPGSDYTSYQE